MQGTGVARTRLPSVGRTRGVQRMDSTPAGVADEPDYVGRAGPLAAEDVRTERPARIKRIEIQC